MKTTGSRGRFCRSAMPSRTLSVILEIVWRRHGPPRGGPEPHRDARLEEPVAPLVGDVVQEGRGGPDLDVQSFPLHAEDEIDGGPLRTSRAQGAEQMDDSSGRGHRVSRASGDGEPAW